MGKKNGSELARWAGKRRCAMHLPPPAHAGAISIFSYSAAPQLVLTLLLATFCSAVGCGKTIAAPAFPAPEGAFRSVSDALVAYRKTREFRVQEELLFESAQDAARLSHMRYTGGVTGYLEVLTNETNAFAAELALVQAHQNELFALVQLYEALGGGWQQ